MKNNILTAIIVALIILALIVGVFSFIKSAPLIYIIWEVFK